VTTTRMLCPFWGMCYNHRAVEHTTKQQLGVASQEPNQGAVQQASPMGDHRVPAAPVEDASRYCPVCSQRLESRRCKLICQVCGYYMSCADYY
jgi:hypothetical protein